MRGGPLKALERRNLGSLKSSQKIGEGGEETK